ncbi:NmrA-like family protein [Nemania sp. FL0916]|nr:NmrA-like family protein [Nemania sp. FL0916]
MAKFTNILLIGATGSIGSLILSTFQKDAIFNLTILQRASSKSRLPSNLKVITVADTFPLEDLTAAFKGQDVVINCMTVLSVSAQFRIVDAAIAARVRRFVPSEYGLNNARPEAQALNAVFANKGKLQAYLREQAAVGRIEWMSISNGMWLKWAIAHEFLGVHVSERRFMRWDDGLGLFSCTTEENTAAALLQALKIPEETRNRNIFLSDFAITQTQLLESLERVQGLKYEVQTIDSQKLIEEKQEAFRLGDEDAAFPLIETGFVTGRYGGHLEMEGTIMNKKLGLPKRELDEVVEEGLRAVGAL